ncbi:hypothetical protein EW146_g348 [Bondarzewia mesenterica]|uniref:N-acetylglucosaminylphosphatidylinositol deacetylase n=1 Tax=Bondarzewia mesenterica TaxID=1095465 RepID=A0A4S4M7R5_9AGAM|nr:hypothetical protein EW146_g348 [Bondarzewia mesenterica]
MHTNPLLVLIPVILAILLRPWDSNNLFLDASKSDASDPDSRVLLLTAHPDDEAFFFGPTITSLASQSSDTELYSLCLSTGDANGLGEIRKQEFMQSLDVLGIVNGKRWVLDKAGLKDNFTATWDAKLVADIVRPYVLEHDITTILTFDAGGISFHPNHKSLFHGVSYLLSTLSDPPEAYGLISLPTFAKYIGPFAPLLAKLDLTVSLALSHLGYPISNIPVSVAGARGYLTAARALTQHRSQMVWFRWLYLSFSRYMWVNEWMEIPAMAIQ